MKIALHHTRNHYASKGSVNRLDFVPANHSTGMQVLLDGHDIRTLDLGWYRSQVGLVAQVIPDPLLGMLEPG